MSPTEDCWKRRLKVPHVDSNRGSRPRFKIMRGLKLGLWYSLRVQGRATCYVLWPFCFPCRELRKSFVVSNARWVARLEWFVVFGLWNLAHRDSAFDQDSRVFAENVLARVEDSTRPCSLREGLVLLLLLQDAVMPLDLLSIEHFDPVVFFACLPREDLLPVCAELCALANLACL